MASNPDMTDSTLTTGTTTTSASGVPATQACVSGRWKDPVPAPLRDGGSSSGGHCEAHSVCDRRTDGPTTSHTVLPFLISMIGHTVLLIVLALMTLPIKLGLGNALIARQGEPSVTVKLEAIDTDPTQEFPNAGALAEEPIPVNFAKAESSAIASPIETAVSSSQTEVAEIPTTLSAITGGTPAKLTRLPGGGLSGRTPEGRSELGAKYGASGPSELAVENALRYLADHQRKDGSWSFNLELDPCNGRCTHSTVGGDSPAPKTAATGLAMLAFLGAGHTHTSHTEYSEVVRKGIYFLRGAAASSDAGYDWQQGSMYGQGIALMALSEALAMTAEKDREKESDLYELVNEGSRFTCNAQHHGGSWGYRPQSPGDTTVTGWQVLSLIAAKRSRIELQTLTLSNAKNFLMTTCTDRDYWFGYNSPPGEKTTTAIGLTLMLYLGESLGYTPFERAIDAMAARGPMLDNIYHDYYATLTLHHSRHRDWDKWNVKLRDHLVATQVSEGHEKGSWHFDDRWGDVGGRLYTTAMCAMTLEVYYRYLPMYEEISEFPLD